MSEIKVNHGATIVDDSGLANPPPYTYGPPPGAYPHPLAHGPTLVQPTVVTGVVPVVMMQQMGPNPTRLICKSCNCEIVTKVETKPSTKTHLFAALLCLIGCWCCCCIPYFVDSCMSTNHYCPTCNAYIGNYQS